MKRIYFIFLAMCLLLLCACGKKPTPLSDEPTTTTVSTSDGVEWDEYRRPPAILLNETQKVEASSYHWSRITDGDKAQLFVDAPRPQKHYSEKHPVLYTETGEKNTVSLSCELPPKAVKATAYKMSDEKKTAIPITVTANGKNHTFVLPDGDFYAYDITLEWERLGNTDAVHYYLYSKVK